MYDFFDPTKLQDKEIEEKRYKLTNMVMAYRNSGHIHLVDSLELTLAVLEEEWEFRLAKKAAMVDSDRKKAVEKANAKSRKKNVSKKDAIKTNPDIIIAGYIKGVDDL